MKQLFILSVLLGTLALGSHQYCKERLKGSLSIICVDGQEYLMLYPSTDGGGLTKTGNRCSCMCRKNKTDKTCKFVQYKGK